MENLLKKFLFGSAVVKINCHLGYDLERFIKLFKEVGFKDNAEYFEKALCWDKQFDEFCEDKFWHIVKLNGGNELNTCLGFHYEKGLGFDDISNVKKYDSDIQVITVDDLIISCNKEHLFQMNGKSILLQDIDKDLEPLDYFCEFYDWDIQEYIDNNGKKTWNILDTQTNEYRLEEDEQITNITDLVREVWDRAFGYYTDEQEYEEVQEVQYDHDTLLSIGNKYGIIDNGTIKYLDEWLQDWVNDIESEEE